MIGPGVGIRVYPACGHTDMRKGIAGLGKQAFLGLDLAPLLSGLGTDDLG